MESDEEEQEASFWRDEEIEEIEEEEMLDLELWGNFVQKNGLSDTLHDTVCEAFKSSSKRDFGFAGESELACLVLGFLIKF
jgi:hypothetical protein